MRKAATAWAATAKRARALPRVNLRRDRQSVGFNANPLLTVALPAWRSKLMLFMLFVAFVRSAAARSI